MSNEFHKYIKAVGTGAKHNFDLSIEQMEEAMGMILDGTIYPEQLSAFLLGWRIKPETTDEFIGAIKSFDKYIKREKIENSIELGYPYDGKCNNPYMFSLIAKELEPYGINIVVTGDKLQPAKGGIVVSQIIQDIDKSSNLYYFDRKNIFPQLSNLTQTRMRLGTRTGFNTIERLLNPAFSDIAFTGVFHKPFMEKYVKIFGNRYKKLVITKGNEGTSEIFSKTQYWIVQNNTTTEYKIDPKYFGIDYKKSWDKIRYDEMVNIINNPTKEFMKLIKLNSAFILNCFNKVLTIEDGYDILSEKL